MGLEMVSTNDSVYIYQWKTLTLFLNYIV